MKRKASFAETVIVEMKRQRTTVKWRWRPLIQGTMRRLPQGNELQVRKQRAMKQGVAM